MLAIGVDTGGTFTDLVLFRDGRIATYKLPSTPGAFERGVLEGVRHLLGTLGEGPAEPFALVHSTTVATNALLERKGAKTALVTTEGFRDVLAIGRQNRPSLYDMDADRPPPLVPRVWRREVAERVSSEGDILRPLDAEEAGRVLDELKAQGAESLAICLLFSFLRPEHEQTLAAMARERGFFASASSEVLPEFREYERTAATVANAYVSPAMASYLGRLETGAKSLGTGRLRIMQSNGGALSARAAGERGVHTLLSGPAAGVLGALSVARQALGTASPKIITFDMGGTSTDVALVDGDIRVSNEAEIEGLPVHVPMMDIHTVGAGGGSIARVDAGGALRVGPESAGADPGPACYGRGGTLPTVTDANLVLGRLDPERFLGGRMRLDPEAARRALEPLARSLNVGLESAAEAVVRVAESNMERAIRVVSVERGHDPREFALFSFGGAGGLHACALAEALGISRVIVPRNPGVLSAWGALCADAVKDCSRTAMLPFGEEALPRLREILGELEAEAFADLRAEGFAEDAVQLNRSLDLRYLGQSRELSAPFEGGSLPAAAEAFHALHAKRYGHAAPGEPMEIVTVRLRAAGLLPKPELDRIASGRGEGARLPGEGPLARWDRGLLGAGEGFRGPALLLEEFSVSFVSSLWTARSDFFGNAILEFEASASK